MVSKKWRDFYVLRIRYYLYGFIWTILISNDIDSSDYGGEAAKKEKRKKEREEKKRRKEDKRKKKKKKKKRKKSAKKVSKKKVKPKRVVTSSPVSPSDADKCLVWKGTVDGRDQDREDGDTFEWGGRSYVVKNGYVTSVCDCYSIYYTFFYSYSLILFTKL